MFNLEWPPHARLHDAQTIALGALLGSCGLYFLCRRGKQPQTDLALGALLPSLFWAAQAASFAFPGAEGIEAEFSEMVPRVRGVWVNERFFSALMLALVARATGPNAAAVAGHRPHRNRRGSCRV